MAEMGILNEIGICLQNVFVIDIFSNKKPPCIYFVFIYTLSIFNLSCTRQLSKECYGQLVACPLESTRFRRYRMPRTRSQRFLIQLPVAGTS